MSVLSGLTLLDSGAYATNGTNISTNPKGTSWGTINWYSETLQYWGSNSYIAASGNSDVLAAAAWDDGGTVSNTLNNDAISAIYAVDGGQPSGEFKMLLFLRVSDPFGFSGFDGYVLAVYTDSFGNQKMDVFWTGGNSYPPYWNMILETYWSPTVGDRITYRIGVDGLHEVYVNEDLIDSGYDYSITWPGYPGIGIQDTYVGINSIYYGDFTVTGTTFTKSITANSSVTPSFRKSPGKKITYNSTPTPTVVKRGGKPITRSVSVTPTVVKQTKKPFGVTVTSSAVVTPMRVFLKALTFTVNSVVGSGGLSGYSSAVLADSPNAYWKMDDSGSTLANSVAGGNPIVLSGGTTGVPGATTALGNAVSFNGSSDYGRVSSLDLSGTDKVSVEMWLTWDTNGSNDALALEHGETNAAKGFALNPSSSSSAGSWAAFTPNNAGGGFDEERMTTRPSAATWHHIVVTIDRTQTTSGSVFNFYVDGVLDAGTQSGAFTQPTLNFQNYPLMVMARSAASNGVKSLFGGGDMQHLAIYPYILTGTQVSTHYGARNTGGTASGIFKQVNAIRSFNATGTPSVLKRINATRIFNATGTPSIIKRLARTIQFAANASVTLQSPRIYLSAITATVTGTPTFTKLVGARRTFNATGTPTISTNKLTAVIQQAITVTVNSTVSTSRRVGKNITQSVTGTPTLAKRILQSLTFNVTGTPSLVRSFVRTINVVVTGTPSIARLAVKPVNIAVTAVASTSMGRKVFKNVGFTATGTSTLTKGVGKSIIQSVTVFPDLIKRLAKSWTVNESVSTAVVKQAGKSITTTATGSATLTKRVRSILPVVANATVNFLLNPRVTIIPVSHKVRGGLKNLRARGQRQPGRARGGMRQNDVHGR
jgi:hypothetical protein